MNCIYCKSRPIWKKSKYCRECRDAKARAYSSRPDIKAKRRLARGKCWPPLTKVQSDDKHFWQRVEKTDSCWLWIGPQSDDEYGVFHSRQFGGRIRAHRYSFWFHYPLKREALAVLAVCHQCDTPLCVNPDHLFLGTLADNCNDMHAKGRARHGVVLGEANNKAKLTASQVLEIRKRAKPGSFTAIGREYGVTAQSIWAIYYGKNWRHLNERTP